MNEIIQQKLRAYACRNQLEEEHAIKEITQEIALWALAEAGFFEHAAFQGGTALRIFHALPRFSEDLDFALSAPNPDFRLDLYLDKVAESMRAYGYQMQVTGKEEAGEAVRMKFLKEDSIGKVVTFDHTKKFRKAVRIKVEVDIRPPASAHSEIRPHDFPIDFPVRLFDLPSLFASKSHALLCRAYVKGRDWYDFSWYVARGAGINFNLLTQAIHQVGPWQGKKIQTDATWYVKAMQERIQGIDWEMAKKDVEPFLRTNERKSLDLWSTAFFLGKLHKLQSTLRSGDNTPGRG